jgi:hypothetical protein
MDCKKHWSLERKRNLQLMMILLVKKEKYLTDRTILLVVSIVLPGIDPGYICLPQSAKNYIV